MLDRKKKYLQIAFNRTLEEIAAMIHSLPSSDRILIEAGYPLIKTYGVRAISAIKALWWQKTSDFTLNPLNPSNPLNLYIIADLKCMDRALTEVEAAFNAGASAATCLGLAPLETIDEFIKRCEEIGIDSMLDMMKVEYPFEVLSKLAKLPKIVMLHRGVDEGEDNREKEIPYHEIERIKSVYEDILIAVAGGETVHEVITGAFNGADIIVVWRVFNESPGKINLIANEFLKELK